MFNLKKRALSTVLATATLLGAIALPAVVVYAEVTTSIDTEYVTYTEKPGSETPLTEVDKTNKPVTVWIGGGNAKQSLDGAEITTNGKQAQLYLYHNKVTTVTDSEDSTNDSTTNAYTNITNAKGVLWAVSESDTQLTFEGTKIKKNDAATISKGRISAGRKPTNYTSSEESQLKAYAIAYKMKTIPNSTKLAKFTDSDKMGSGATIHDTYEVIAAVKIDVKQAATSINVFNNASAVKAYEEKSTNKAYAENAQSGKFGADSISGTFPLALKKTTAVTVGIGGTASLFISGTAGVDSNKAAVPAEQGDDSTYTISIVPDKNGNEYIKLFDNDSGDEVDKITLKQSEIGAGFGVMGKAVMPKIAKDGKVSFVPSKSTLLISNDQSGKSAKVTVTVTNGAKDPVEITETTDGAGDGIAITTPYKAVATYTIDLAKGVYADTTGTTAANVLTAFEKVTITEPNVIKEGTEEDSSKWTFAYKLGPKFTPNGTEQDVKDPAKTDGSNLTDSPFAIQVLVKPVVQVYESKTKDGDTAMITKLKADLVAASVTKPTLPKVDKNTSLYQVATGFKASVAKDNTTVTFTLPKTDLASDENMAKVVYLAVCYGGDEENVLIQKITVSPKTALNYTVSTTGGGSPATFTVVEGKATDTTNYKLTGLTTNTEYEIAIVDNAAVPVTYTVDNTDSNKKFQLVAGSNVIVSGNKIKLKTGKVTGSFKIKIGSFTYTVDVGGADAAEAPTTLNFKLTFKSDGQADVVSQFSTTSDKVNQTVALDSSKTVALLSNISYKIYRDDETTTNLTADISASEATWNGTNGTITYASGASNANGTLTIKLDNITFTIPITRG